MNAHTPGPWRIYGFEIVHHINGSLGDPTICSLADSGDDLYSGDIEQFMGNARLIAASPDLLAALDMMERHFSRYDDTHNNLVLEQARAAIHKATKGKA